MYKITFSAFNFTTRPYLGYLARDNKVSVFISEKSKLPDPENTNVFRVKFAFKLLEKILKLVRADRVKPEYILNIKKYFINEPQDVLIACEFYNLTFHQFLSEKRRNSNTKLYLWSETRQWPKFWLSRWLMYAFWWYFKSNLRFVEKVFVFSEAGKEFFSTNAPEVEVVVLSAPIDITQFYFDSKKEYMVGGVLRIIMNARYVPLKDHRTFFKALAVLRQKNIKFKVSLIGRGGHLEAELEQYAGELGIENFITWLAPVPIEQLRAIYSAHDVLVLASNREAIGMVVPEAMACGLATVTSSAVGANTYVEEGKTGLIFEAGNVQALASSLEKFSNRELTNVYGKNAAEVISLKYDTDILGKKLTEELVC